MFFNKSEKIERLNKKCCELATDVEYYKDIVEARTKDCEQSSIAYEKLHDKYEDLEDKYNDLKRDHRMLQHDYNGRIRIWNDNCRQNDKNFANNKNKILVLLALIAQSKELVSMTFSKSRLDECLGGENDKFYLYLINYNGYYTWKFDIKYWDLFPVPITVPANCKKVDNITELLKV